MTTKDLLCISAPDGRPVHYVLDENGEAVPWTGSVVEWGMRFESARRVLKKTRIGKGKSIITAFLGIDDAAAVMRPATRPDIFGTLDETTDDEFFDATPAEALERHRKVVARVVYEKPKQFHVWSEGWAATGESGIAQLHGSVEATSFQEACDKLFSDNKSYDRETLSYWGCRLFDNKKDAKKEYG